VNSSEKNYHFKQVFFKENVRCPIRTCRDRIFSDSRDSMIIFSDSRDPNRVPKTP